ncbi:MAG TPA: SsgA family sporulation/cell division regulator [Trebonia sp.]|jgi:hypothetical protein
MIRTVSSELGLQLVVPQEDEGVPLVASLYYSAEDPYAIRIAFHAGLDEPIEWVLGRELLAQGLSGREGLGDVQVWPSAAFRDSVPGGVLNIALSSPFGQAHFEAPATDLGEFLHRTYQVVPIGRESEYIDMDTELSALLRQAL